MNRRREQYYQHAHDERVEPHHDLVPGGMPDPNWGAVEIHPNQKKMPVGDPTLWANTITTLIDADPILGSTPRVIAGGQVILAQASDRYARSWSMVGNLSLTNGAWSSNSGSLDPAVSPDFETSDPLSVWLEITQGIEKVAFTQLLLLKSGDTGQNFGLCNNQFVLNGGPYGQIFGDFDVLGNPMTATRSFATIGALIGNTISVRALYVRGGTVGQLPVFPSGTISLLLTPYAPGAGI